MASYWAYWRRGWWCWLLVLCANGVLMPLFLPLALALHGNEPAYWIAAITVWLIVGAPLWGWLFERFAAAAPPISGHPQGESRPSGRG